MRSRRGNSPLTIGLTACVVLLLSHALAGPLLARTWTDYKGQQIQGNFIRMFDGLVVIQQGNKMVKIVPKDLSEEDLEFLRNKLPADQQELLPEPPAVREWHDAKGNTITAQMLGFDNGKVQFRYADDTKKKKAVPFAKLSQADQDYIRAELARLGHSQVLPGPPQSDVAAVPSMGPQFPMPGPRPVNPMANLQQFQQNLAQQAEQRRQENARIQQENQRMQQQQAEFAQQATERQRQQEADRQRIQQEQQRLIASQIQQQQQQQIQQQFLQQRMEVFFCSHCNKQVPSNVKAGDYCPHCGTFFDQKVLANGKVEKSDNWFGGFTYFGLRGGAAVIAMIVVGSIAVAVRAARNG